MPSSIQRKSCNKITLCEYLNERILNPALESWKRTRKYGNFCKFSKQMSQKSSKYWNPLVFSNFWKQMIWYFQKRIKMKKKSSEKFQWSFTNLFKRFKRKLQETSTELIYPHLKLVVSVRSKPQASKNPLGFWVCHLQRSQHMSSSPNSACQFSFSLARAGSQ